MSPLPYPVAGLAGMPNNPQPAPPGLTLRIIRFIRDLSMAAALILALFIIGWGAGARYVKKADVPIVFSAYCEGYLNGNRQLTSEDINALLNDTSIEPDSMMTLVSQLLAKRANLLPLKRIIGVSTGDSLFYRYIQNAEGGL
jgi:hypothetical protein